MSTKLTIITALSIAAVAVTGTLAYSVQHGITPAFISLPEESVWMFLIPISPTQKRSSDVADCKNAERPKII